MLNGDVPKFGSMFRPDDVSLHGKLDQPANSPDLPRPWIRAAQLPELFCSWDLAYRCTRSGWLRPIVQGKRRTIYRVADVLECMRRIEAGELPSPRRNKAV
jgi:hypothetical protein